MFNMKSPAASGPMLLLKSLGFDPQAMIAMFSQAQQIVVDFAKQAEANHATIQSDIVKSHVEHIDNHFTPLSLKLDFIAAKLDLIHADLKAMNPDHAGDLGVPVEINGDTVSIGEALAVEIDRKHAVKESPEYKLFIAKEFGPQVDPQHVDVTETWMEHRRNERRKN